MIPRRNRGNPDDQVFIFIEYILANLRHAFRDCNGSQAAALAERDASDADQSFRKLGTQGRSFLSHILLLDGNIVASGDQNVPGTAGKTPILIMLCHREITGMNCRGQKACISRNQKKARIV